MAAAKPRGAAHAPQVMTPQNEQRLVDIKAKDSSGKAVLKAHRISIKAATRIKVEAMNRKGASKPSPPSSP
jgi:hypothetical protein